MPIRGHGQVMSEAELLNFSESNVEQDFVMEQNQDQFDEDEDCISRDQKQAPFYLNESKIKSSSGE